MCARDSHCSVQYLLTFDIYNFRYLSWCGVCGVQYSGVGYVVSWCGVCGLHLSGVEYVVSWCGVCGVLCYAVEYMVSRCGVGGVVWGIFYIL